MNKLLVASIAFAALGAVTANAADMPVAPAYKAPPVVAAPSWTGFYAGASVGKRWTKADETTTSFLELGTPLTFPIVAVPFNGDAFRFAGHLGFNWQLAPRWVAGVEVDYGSADTTATLVGFIYPNAFGPGFAPADSFSVKTTWDASARVRAAT